MMQARQIKWLLILIALSVAAVITAQLYWMYNAYKLQEDSFKSNAFKSVKLVAENIEKGYGCFEVFNKIELDKGEGIVMLLSRKSKDTVTIIDTIKQFTSSYKLDTITSYDSYLSFPLTGEVFIKYHYNPVDSGTNFNELNIHNHSHNIKNQDKDSIFSGKRPVTYFMGEEYFRTYLDSILNLHLIENGISSPYFFYLKNESNQEFILGNVGLEYSSKTKPFTATLYENSFFFAPQKLYVWLPDKDVFLFGRMKFILISSLLVLLVLISVAYVMARTILKQKKLSQMKKDFVNNMTHEFKTPISNIALAIDTIDNLEIVKNNLNIDDYLKIIEKENKRLSDNVHKILEISQLESPRIAFSSQKLSVKKLLEEAVNSFDLVLQKSGGKFIINSEDIDVSIMGDKYHLTNLFFNLFDNAIKYNKSKPNINISWSKKNGEVEIVVLDNGIGMSRSDIDNIFTPFYRIHTGDVHDVKGFGLGLSYVKKVIEIHRGKIIIDSEVGKGSSFIIRLPIAKHKEENIDAND